MTWRAVSVLLLSCSLPLSLVWLRASLAQTEHESFEQLLLDSEVQLGDRVFRGDKGLLTGLLKNGDLLLLRGERGLRGERTLGDLCLGDRGLLGDLGRGLRGDLGPLGDLILDVFGDLILGERGLRDLCLGDLDLIRGDLDLPLGDLDLPLGDRDLSFGDLDLALGDLDLALGDLVLALGDLDLGLGDLVLALGDLDLAFGDLDLALGDLDFPLGVFWRGDRGLTGDRVRGLELPETDLESEPEEAGDFFSPP